MTTHSRPPWTLILGATKDVPERNREIERQKERKDKKKTRHAPDKVQLDNGPPSEPFVAKVRRRERELKV